MREAETSNKYMVKIRGKGIRIRMPFLLSGFILPNYPAGDIIVSEYIVDLESMVNDMKENLGKYNCSVEAAMDIIGGKYKVIILWHLIKEGTLRFSEIQRLIPQATPKMLSSQLKELEAAGIVDRTLYPVVPPKTEYSLSEFGKTLIPIVTSLRDWGNMYFEKMGAKNPCE